MSLRKSSGTLYACADKVFVAVDEGIVQLTRALIPPYFPTQPQRYAPHITVVRNEPFSIRPKKTEISFRYDPVVQNDDTYWWLNVYCSDLSDIRIGMGLEPSSQWSRPPDGTECFHITVGNTKHLARHSHVL